jgi:hypothetical protein
MTRSARITLAWADGDHPFRLAIGQLQELQDKCGAGPPEILRRLMSQTWHVNDVRETLRLGLIGGGMPPAEALTLVKRYVDAEDRPLAENVLYATLVVQAAIVGVEDESLEKPKGAEETTAETTASPSPPSTE